MSPWTPQATKNWAHLSSEQKYSCKPFIIIPQLGLHGKILMILKIHPIIHIIPTSSQIFPLSHHHPTATLIIAPSPPSLQRTSLATLILATYISIVLALTSSISIASALVAFAVLILATPPPPFLLFLHRPPWPLALQPSFLLPWPWIAMSWPTPSMLAWPPGVLVPWSLP